MLALITAALSALANLPSLFADIKSSIDSLTNEIKISNSYKNIQQANQITNTEIPASNTTAQNDATAKDIQKLVAGS